MSEIIITTNPPDLVARLNDAPRFLRRIAKTLDRENELTVGHIVAKRMTGKGPFAVGEGKLGVRTGRLRRSLRRTKAVVVNDGVVSAIGTNVVYMGPHEFGATTPPHTITAKNGKALRFGMGAGTAGGGKVLFRRSVKHPGSKIPARRPIFRGIEDRVPAYNEALGKAATEHLNGGNS